MSDKIFSPFFGKWYNQAKRKMWEAVMRRIIPTISASLMLAAGVVTGQLQFNLISHETKGPAQSPASYNLNVPEGAEVDGGFNQSTEPAVTVEPQGASKTRIIIQDNDYVAPRYERDYTPIPNSR
jgi:hypothetical protein